MSEMHDFEDRFAERLRAYAAPAARRPTPEAVSKAVGAAKLGQGGLHWSRTRRRPRIWMLAAALLLLGLIGGGLAGAFLLRDEEDPTVPPGTAGGIAYQTAGSDGHLALVDPTTGQSRALTPPLTETLASRGCERQPVEVGLILEMAWSPDGSALAFQLAAGLHLNSSGKVRCGLLVVSSDGATLRTLLPPREPDRGRGPEQHYSPSWAPDGSHLAVALERSVALVALDGSPPVDLGSPCEDCRPTYLGAIGGWSPDGTRIAAAFTDDQSADGEIPVIAVVDVASRTWTVLWEFAGGEGDTALTVRGWFPDGTVAADSGDGVYSLDPELGGESTLLPFSEPLGTWSPDQTHDALKPQSEGDGLRIRDLSSGEINRIADWEEPDTTIAWSPDGAQLAVLRSRSEIWLIGADGSDPTRLVTNAGVPYIRREPSIDIPVTWQPVSP